MRSVNQRMQPEEIRAIADIRASKSSETPLIFMEVVNLAIVTIRDKYTTEQLFVAKFQFMEQIRQTFPPIRADLILSKSIVLKRINKALATEKIGS